MLRSSAFQWYKGLGVADRVFITSKTSACSPSNIITPIFSCCLSGGCGKAAHLPRTKKNGDFFEQIFRLRFFYTEPQEAWVRSHTSCVNFFFCRCLPHSEYLHKCHIFTQVSQYLHKSVTYLDIFTQSVTSTLRYYVTHNKYQMVPLSPILVD
jgi:hypothetical protein